MWPLEQVAYSKPSSFANPCPWCGSSELRLETDVWDPETVARINCSCTGEGPLVGGTPPDNRKLSDVEWDLLDQAINSSAWLIWNMRGGPPDRFKNVHRFGEGRKTKHTPKRAIPPDPNSKPWPKAKDGKPCPFCASSDTDVEDYGDWIVVCSNCLAHGPYPVDSDDEPKGERNPTSSDIRNAVKRWNRRETTSPHEQVER